jgi:hypothetical protein
MAGEILELMFSRDRVQQARVVGRVQTILSESFAADKSRVTQSEVKRRFGFLEQLIRELRSDYGWAYERILDALPVALRCKLDGAHWDPTAQRTLWTPNNSL